MLNTTLQIHTAEVSKTANIWLLADDFTAQTLITHFNGSGFGLRRVTDANELYQPANTDEIAAVVLSQDATHVLLFDVLRNFRALSRLPVFLILERENEMDGLIGLELGADDFITKPINQRVLLSRLRAVLRRTQSAISNAMPPPLLKGGEITLDESLRAVWLGQDKLHLTTVEFNLLQIFLRSQGMPLTRDELVQRVLGRACQPTDRSLDVHVSNLRKKLGRNDYIKGLRGIGYVFIPQNLAEFQTQLS